MTNAVRPAVLVMVLLLAAASGNIAALVDPNIYRKDLCGGVVVAFAESPLPELPEKVAYATPGYRTAGHVRAHRPGPLNTRDIDAIHHYMNGSLHPATFVPGAPREEVVRKALESAGRTLGGKDTSTLETKATVDMYTWKDEEGNWVEGRKAWLVVVDGLPIVDLQRL